MTGKVRVGLVGCGVMGTALAEATVAGPGEIVAVADVDSGRAQAAADKFGCEPFAGVEALARKANIDAVIVATPPFQHCASVLVAAEAGKHVFCEKPLALSVRDCRRMIEACGKSGVKLMVGQVLRYMPPFAKMKQIVDSGELGQPAMVCTTRLHKERPERSQGWRMSKTKSGGTLLGVSVHEFDYMCCILGEPKSVFARAAKFVATPRDYPDLVVTTVEFNEGRFGSLTSGVCASSDLYLAQILCTEGSVFLENWSAVTCGRFGEDVRQVPLEGDQTESAVEREVREFLEAVSDDKPVTIPGEDGLRAVALACAAYESAEKGQVVAIQ